MKKQIMGIFAVSLFAMSMLLLPSVAASKGGILELETNSFSTLATATFEDDVSKLYREDWYLIENVEPGLMTMELSWDNSLILNCYIATSASLYSAIASGTTECSYSITTAGDYYIGVYLSARGRDAVTTPYTGIVSYYTGGSTEPDETAPIVDITSPNNGVIVEGVITISATASDSESGIDCIDCNIGGINLLSDSTSPYSWTFDTTSLTDGFYTITVTAYDNAGNLAVDTISIEVYNENVNPGEGEKIAVFFWASDAGTQANIDEYWDVLQLEGYTKKFDFKDTMNFAADFATVEAYEDPEDTVFFYLFGHGNNNGEDSLTAFAPGTSVVYSSEMRVFFDTLDAERIGCLIESCHSGGFPLDFEAPPYLMMSTSDEDHNSYALATLPGEGLFSDAFFDHVLDGYNAVDSFYFARQVVFDNARNSHMMQYPLISDYSDYVWFI